MSCIAQYQWRWQPDRRFVVEATIAWMRDQESVARYRSGASHSSHGTAAGVADRQTARFGANRPHREAGMSADAPDHALIAPQSIPLA
ncbi:MAG: hypothetical protein RLO48_16280 [Bauldia litoralis]